MRDLLREIANPQVHTKSCKACLSWSMCCWLNNSGLVKKVSQIFNGPSFTTEKKSKLKIKVWQKDRKNEILGVTEP